MQSLRDTLQSVLGATGSLDRLSSRSSSESVRPATSIRVVGEPVTDVLVVEHGLFEVAAPGESPRWATAGSIVGLAASLSGALSQVAVSALRHGRLSRVPAAALRDFVTDERISMSDVARLAQLPDHGLATLPPDPLIVTALLEAAAWEHARIELNRVAAMWHSRLEWRAVKNPLPTTSPGSASAPDW